MINKIFLFGCNAINEKKQNITFYGKFSIKFFFQVLPFCQERYSVVEEEEGFPFIQISVIIM
mgnify:CR=1 FL=1